MKKKASVKRRCEFCRIGKRNGKLVVVCSDNPRHNQRQG